MKKLENWFKKKGKGKYFKWISSKEAQDRTELRRMQGKIRKMITGAKNKSLKRHVLH
jgi:hypothetical protein